ncbi:MAG: septal ring lytic transglycosylase RlpA family protein, partial [Bacteroidia bacterium]
MFLKLKFLLALSSCLLFSMPHFNGNYCEEGFASYYSEEFNGRKTASGEIFDMTDFTAAHRKLSFNTFLKVTNIQNNLSLIVRVNDRGPYVKNRILDLSEAAARKIESYHHGYVKVKAEEIILTPLLPEQDSLFSNNLVMDCLGNFDKLSDYSFSIWSSTNLLHTLYISNELYLKE